jgi:hypothetical protein
VCIGLEIYRVNHVDIHRLYQYRYILTLFIGLTHRSFQLLIEISYGTCECIFRITYTRMKINVIAMYPQFFTYFCTN